ncbi:hypothetical protein X753_31685 [Mesorhizobium sp. LNJC399B00]|nr:hypothetical protein X753_31685 [Mesorhizobium sp. LNJC399B00]
MRGGDDRTGELFSYVDLEVRVRRNHPLRAIRTIVNETLSALEREFAALYSPIGRPSIPSEKLLRAMLLQAFNSVRSESDIAAKFLAAVLAQPKVKKLLSTDHFSVDGTLIGAWASMKSVKPKDGSGEASKDGSGEPPAGAIRTQTFMTRSGRTIRMPRPPILTPGSTARVKARTRSFASSGMG